MIKTMTSNFPKLQHAKKVKIMTLILRPFRKRLMNALLL